ncbi:UNKNOWN [Stylonychia lemnae]|uniref:Uncharacterized protein n=1 Tax=Stylonychia lemnae TaxID=5949 RepID=A0A078B9Z6_STYLE|nr:UNKNOWN [Stylonychia lemnae]|eukprot:CDW91046.1 UNKNOWN [Stylonychia lemnae]
MRPTDLKFRSIREKTPELPTFTPEYTRQGQPLFAALQSRKSSLSMQKRIQSATKVSLNQAISNDEISRNRPNSSIRLGSYYKNIINPLGFGQSQDRFSLDHSNPLSQVPSTYMNQNLGPGSYDADLQYHKLTSKACPVKYQHLTIGQKLAASGDFHFEGSRLVYEPSYKDPRKKSGDQDNYQNIISRIMNGEVDTDMLKQLSKKIQTQNNSSIAINDSATKINRNKSMGNHHSSFNNSMAVMNQYQNMSFQNDQEENDSIQARMSKKQAYKYKSPYKQVSTSNTSYKKNNYYGRNQIRKNLNLTQNPQNIIIFMGDTININPQNTFIINQGKTFDNGKELYNPVLSENILNSTFDRGQMQRASQNVYRILASDSNVKSGYFQHGFQCPTKSSTFQRKKPIAYDLEVINNSQPQKRPRSGKKYVYNRRQVVSALDHSILPSQFNQEPVTSTILDQTVPIEIQSEQNQVVVNIQLKEKPYSQILDVRKSSKSRYSEDFQNSKDQLNFDQQPKIVTTKMTSQRNLQVGDSQSMKVNKQADEQLVEQEQTSFRQNIFGIKSSNLGSIDNDNFNYLDGGDRDQPSTQNFTQNKQAPHHVHQNLDQFQVNKQLDLLNRSVKSEQQQNLNNFNSLNQHRDYEPQTEKASNLSRIMLKSKDIHVKLSDMQSIKSQHTSNK